MRPPDEPSAVELASLPTQAIIALPTGEKIALNLQTVLAPVTVWRFVKLVQAGYYNNLSFHRVVPNFVAQGGSPGANEYMGASRFARDEVGAKHERGAVGVSERGLHIGDMQFFIELVDLPRFTHEYTVFANVPIEPGRNEEPFDLLLEGAKIKSITVR